MSLLTTAVAALAGALLFERLDVPAGALLGAMVAVAAVNLLGVQMAALPEAARFLSFAAIGWMIGQTITRDTIGMILRSSVVIAVSVVALLVFGAVLAWTLVRFGSLDPATAFLATSPGGLSQMAAVGAAVGANASLVVTLHTVRVVAVIVLAPFVARWLPSSV